jgi:hypothetical protein
MDIIDMSNALEKFVNQFFRSVFLVSIGKHELLSALCVYAHLRIFL